MGPKQKLLVIMGATGAGKTKLSIDMATRFDAENINADKIQLYEGLDITTNKVPVADRQGVPHHLLGEMDPADGEVSPAEFRSLADCVIRDIATRGRLPILVGGSNSLIQALVSQEPAPGSADELRYECCFLWVDVGRSVLFEYLNARVDEMMEQGMAEELSRFRRSGSGCPPETAIRKAIGVPEFDRFLSGESTMEAAVEEVKRNTRELAARQLQKIEQLRWRLHRLDATQAFNCRLQCDPFASLTAWETDVLRPSMKIVESFVAEHRSPA